MDSCQCKAKPIQYCKVKKKKNKTGDETSKIGSYNRQPWNLYFKKIPVGNHESRGKKINKEDMET